MTLGAVWVQYRPMPDFRLPEPIAKRIKEQPERKDHGISMQKTVEILLSEALNLRDNIRQQNRSIGKTDISQAVEQMKTFWTPGKKKSATNR